VRIVLVSRLSCVRGSFSCVQTVFNSMIICVGGSKLLECKTQIFLQVPQQQAISSSHFDQTTMFILRGCLQYCYMYRGRGHGSKSPFIRPSHVFFKYSGIVRLYLVSFEGESALYHAMHMTAFIAAHSPCLSSKAHHISSLYQEDGTATDSARGREILYSAVGQYRCEIIRTCIRTLICTELTRCVMVCMWWRLQCRAT